MFGRKREPSSSSPASASGAADSVENAVIVRRLMLTDARVIGFLPAIASAARGLPDLLTHWAATATNFVAGPIGVVPDWTSWAGSAGGTVVADEQRTRLFSLVPAPCVHPSAATPGLEEAISNHRGSFSRILVNLSGYASPGHMPDAAEAVDGVVMVVPTGRIRRGRLKTLFEELGPRKSLGAILVD
jgi:hypothetical protein